MILSYQILHHHCAKARLLPLYVLQSWARGLDPSLFFHIRLFTRLSSLQRQRSLVIILHLLSSALDLSLLSTIA
jgi:hypothetical protein